MLIQYQLKGLTGYHSWACMLDSPLAAVRLSVFVTPLIYILGHLNYCIWVTAIICRFSHWRYFDLSNPLGSLIADPLLIRWKWILFDCPIDFSLVGTRPVTIRNILVSLATPYQRDCISFSIWNKLELA